MLSSTSWLWVTLRFSYKRQELITLRKHMGSSPVFGGVRVAHLLVFCVVVVVSLCPVYCVPNVASFSRLSILDCPFVLPVSLDCPFLIAPSCCQFLWIVHSWSPLRFSLTFISYQCNFMDLVYFTCHDGFGKWIKNGHEPPGYWAIKKNTYLDTATL